MDFYSSLLDVILFCSFVIFFYTVGRTPRTQGCYLQKRQHKHRINSLKDIDALSGTRTHVHALDRAATMVGNQRVQGQHKAGYAEQQLGIHGAVRQFSLLSWRGAQLIGGTTSPVVLPRI
jgi:hypothetical protein